MNELQARNKPNSGCGCNSGMESQVQYEMRNKPNSGCGCSAVLFTANGDNFMAVFKDGAVVGAVKVTEAE